MQTRTPAQLASSPARPWLDVLLASMPAAHRALRKSFPTTGDERIEDALQSAVVSALASPAAFERAWLADGAESVRRLYRVVAWRQMRAMYRRHANRLELGWDLSRPLGSRPAGQELAVGLSRGFSAAIEVAVAHAGGAQPDKVRAALLDKLESGDPDTVVSKRHDVRREYLNRAKRCFQGLLRNELGLAA